MTLGFSVVGTVHLVALPTVLAAVGVLAAAPVATARAHVAGGLAGLVAANVLGRLCMQRCSRPSGRCPGPCSPSGSPCPSRSRLCRSSCRSCSWPPACSCRGHAVRDPGALVVAGVAGVLSMQLGSSRPPSPDM